MKTVYVKNLLFSLAFILSLQGVSQNSMGVGTDTPSPNAVLELVSPTNNQGFLVPRLTTAQRTDSAFTGNLTVSDNGLMVFDSDDGQFYFWMDGFWQPVSNQVANGDSALFADTSSYSLRSDSSGFASTSGMNIAEILLNGNDAGGSLITNLADPVDPQDAANKSYVDAQSGGTSVWNTAGDDIFYDLGRVGLKTSTPSSDLQIGDDFHFFHYENAPFELEGEIIAENLYSDGTESILYSKDGRGEFILLSDGQIEFLHADSSGAGTDAITLNSIEASLTLKASLDAEFRGAVEIGALKDSTSFSSGTISYGGNGFFGYNGQNWNRLDGLSFPVNENLAESATNIFSLSNFGTAGVARFEISNTSAFGNALTINNNSQEANSRGIRVDHSGFGNAGEFLVSGSGGPNTQYAVLARTFGTGSAGRFEIDNNSNNSSAVLGRIDAGTGNAVEGYTIGLGPAGRFTNANASNGSVTFVVNNDGTNSVALFQNTANATSSAVEIVNNGSGAGLTIQSAAGTTRFGNDAFIAGPMTTTGAVYSNTREITTNETILDTDHIIYINSSVDITVTFPGASLHDGREIIIFDASTGGSSNTLTSVEANDFIFSTIPQESLASGHGGVAKYVLRSIGGNWVVINSN